MNKYNIPPFSFHLDGFSSVLENVNDTHMLSFHAPSIQMDIPRLDRTGESHMNGPPLTIIFRHLVRQMLDSQHD